MTEAAHFSAPGDPSSLRLSGHDPSAKRGGAFFRSLLAAEAFPLTAAGLFAMAGGILELVPYWLIYRMMAVLTGPDPALTDLLSLAGAMLAATVLRFVIGGVGVVASHAVAFRIARQLRKALAAKLAQLPVGAIETRTGDHKKTILDDPGGIEGLVAHTFPDAVAGLFTPLAGALLLVFVDWQMTLVSLALIPVGFFAQLRAFGAYSENVARWHAAEAEANGALLAYVGGLATLKAFNRTASTLERLRAAIQALADLAAAMTRRSASAYAVFTIALSTNLLIVLPVGLLLHVSGRLDAPTFVLFSLLGATLTAPLLRLLVAMSAFERQRQGWSRIVALLEYPALPQPAERGRPDHFDITFDAVSFSYDDRPALQDVTFSCPAGRVTALVGTSGAGKSTLVALVARFHEVGSGSIRIGGVDVRRLATSTLQSMIATVFQNPYFFAGSIADNLRIAAPSADMEDINRAISAAGLSDLVNRLPRGLDTLIGDNGARLSGGERQRLAIARAVIKSPPILLLDEATAFADPENELSIQTALSQLAAGRTVVVVAHRLSTIVDADQIVVLNAGRVEACGIHDDLLKHSRTYSRLWAAQSRATAWELRTSWQKVDPS